MKVVKESHLFMVHSSTSRDSTEIWFMDRGCSNHMLETKNLFKELDESLKSEVRLGDNKQMNVEGKGTLAIKTSQSNIKLLNDVQSVPGLAHNLLSVGQLLNAGYSLLFDDGCCSVYDKKSGHRFVRIPMA